MGRMVKRDPHVVLGVHPGASGAVIKAAWRRLARLHHPDLTGSDPEAARAATRQMAQINAAYEVLREPERRRAAAEAAAEATDRPDAEDRGAPGRNAGGAAGGRATRAPAAPRSRPARPVTARFDTSSTYAQRNQTLTRGGRPSHVRKEPPARIDRGLRDQLRASEPTGPLRRGRLRGFEAPPPPALTDAQATVLEFGKFRGHTLGEVAAFEPSYIDWISDTITRDLALVAAARVIRDDLDERAIVRPRRGVRPGAPRL